MARLALILVITFACVQAASACPRMKAAEAGGLDAKVATTEQSPAKIKTADDKLEDALKNSDS